MAKGIHDLGNGNGKIYVVDPDGSTIIDQLPNNKSGARRVKVLGLQSSTLALNSNANSKITIDSISGSGNVTNISVDGVSLIDNSVSYGLDGSGTEERSLAGDLADEINVSSNKYNATSVGNDLYIIDDSDQGDSINGVSPLIKDSGDLSTTTNAFQNGSDQDEVYHQGHGYRFYLNADYDSEGCSGETTAPDGSTSGAIEITKYIVNRGLQSAFPYTEKTISSSDDTVSLTREAAITRLNITSLSSGNSLGGIDPQGFADSDIVIISALSSSNSLDVKDGVDNIELNGGNNVTLSDGMDTVSVYYNSSDGKFYEIARSVQNVPTVSNFRNNSFPLGVYGYTSTDIDNISSIDPDSDNEVQEIIGETTLSSDKSISFTTTNAVKGDEVWVYYNADVDLNGHSLTIMGLDLSSKQAEGGWIIKAYYDGSNVHSTIYPNLDKDLSNNPIIEEKYIDSSVKGSSIELLSDDISFESSETGDIKYEIPYPCIVKKVTASVSKAIEATDDATLVVKDDSGGSMGTITMTKGSSIGTTFNIEPSSNNLFDAGDVLQMTSAKSTSGGKVKVSVKLERTDTGTQETGINSDVYRTAKVDLSSSEILSLNTTPQSIVSAPGTGKILEFVSGFVQYSFNSSAYATTAKLNIAYNGSFDKVAQTPDILDQTADAFAKFTPTDDGSTPNMSDDTAIEVEADSSDPTGGDSTATVFITYRIIEL